MSECKIYLNKFDLTKMMHIIGNFPEYDLHESKSFKLLYYSCEIGYTLDMVIETKINGIYGELKIPIVGVSDW